MFYLEMGWRNECFTWRWAGGMNVFFLEMGWRNESFTWKWAGGMKMKLEWEQNRYQSKSIKKISANAFNFPT